MAMDYSYVYLHPLWFFSVILSTCTFFFFFLLFREFYLYWSIIDLGFPRGSVVKNHCRCSRHWFSHLHRSQLCHVVVACITCEAIRHVQGHPRWMDHSEEFWKNTVYWGRKLLIFFPGETHEQYEKTKRYPGRWAPVPTPPTNAPYPGVTTLQCATWDEQRPTTNSSSKKEVTGWNWEQCSVVDMSVSESKIWLSKENIP